jgi:hypothetical protein
MITKERTGNVMRTTFDSLDEYATHCERNLARVQSVVDRNEYWAFGESGHDIDDALDMCRNGWQSKQDEAIEIAEDAIKAIEREIELPKWEPIWDVSGGSVDVGAFLSGVPECMIEYPITEVSSIGRVVTICTSVSASGAVDPDELIKRGTMVAALAMMLEKLGYNTEIWADLSASSGRTKLHERVMVKSAHDMIDVARTLYAVANPSFLRVLGFASMWDLPYDMRKSLGVGSSYGMPNRPEENLPEGTLYLREQFSSYNYDTKAELIAQLKRLGIIE